MVPKVHPPTQASNGRDLRCRCNAVSPQVSKLAFGVCVWGGGGWPSTYFGQSSGMPPTSPGQHSGICLRGTAGKSQSVPIQGLRSQWAADEASDFAKSIHFITPIGCPWMETDVLSPAAYSCSGPASGTPGLQGLCLQGLWLLEESLCLKVTGVTFKQSSVI